MARLKASVLVESLAALSIVAIILAMAFTSMSRVQAQSKSALRFRAEMELQELLDNGIQEALDFEDQGITYRVSSERLAETDYLRVSAVAYRGSVMLCERQRIERIKDD